MSKAEKFLCHILPVLILLSLSAGANAKVLKIATLSPDGSSWMVTMRAAGKEIEAKTEGRVKFKFYPGGVMGDDKAALKKIRFGQLQGAAVAGGSVARFFPDSQIYNLPMKFRSFGEVDYVRERMDDLIIDGLERGGLVSFGLGEGGMAYIMSDSQISTIEQLKKKKVWVPPGDSGAYLAAKTFGVSPIPLSLVDVLPGLQTGMIDTVATSPIAAIALQWHTQVKHLTELPLLYFYALLAIDKKHFDKLAKVDQVAVRNIMGEAFKKIDRQNRKDNIAALNALQNQGITLTKPSEQNLALWRELGAAAEQKLIAEGVVSIEILSTLNRLLDEYHKTRLSAKKNSD